MTLAAGASADPSSASAASSVDGDGGSNLSAGTRQLVKLCTLAGGEPSVAAVLARVVSMAVRSCSRACHLRCAADARLRSPPEGCTSSWLRGSGARGVLRTQAMVERHLPAGRRVDEAQVLRCLNLVMFDFFHFQVRPGSTC